MSERDREEEDGMGFSGLVPSREERRAEREARRRTDQIPALDELLARHPAPWRIDDDEFFRDANEATIEQDCDDPSFLTRQFVKLVNRYAEGNV